MPAEASKPKEGVQVSMRHTKITAAEAAMLAGELNKPSWQSRNEGIHERVSFEDSIWGFDLAGGSYYKTPLRVTAVKTDSRADKAGIRPGDKLLRINDIDTSTLTIQEAHEIIIESGIHLKIAVTAPDDLEDSYHCWEDPLDTGYDSEEERRKQKEKEAKRVVHAKVSSYWSLQWPWVSKRRVIYRESNCFMVPSKYEDHHREKFPVQTFGPKVPEDIVLHSAKSEKGYVEGTLTSQSPIDKVVTDEPQSKPVLNDVDNTTAQNNDADDSAPKQKDSIEPEKSKETVQNGSDHQKLDEDVDAEVPLTDSEDILTQEEEEEEKSVQSEAANGAEESDHEKASDPNEVETDVSQSDVSVVDDDVIDDVLAKPDDITNGEEENILNEILSDGEKLNDEVKR